MSCLHLIATGGTIDKIYNPLTGQLDVGPPVLPGILAAAGLTADDLAVTEVLRKDSLEITDDERARLAAAVAAAPAERILITTQLVLRESCGPAVKPVIRRAKVKP